MTPLTLAEIRATIIDATPDMTAALLRDLDWMIRDGFDVRPAPAEDDACSVCVDDHHHPDTRCPICRYTQDHLAQSPALAEEMAFDQERFDMETAQLRAGIRKPGEQSDNWPPAPAEARCNHWPGQPRCDVCGMKPPAPAEGLPTFTIGQVVGDLQPGRTRHDRCSVHGDIGPAESVAAHLKSSHGMTYDQWLTLTEMAQSPAPAEGLRGTRAGIDYLMSDLHLGGVTDEEWDAFHAVLEKPPAPAEGLDVETLRRAVILMCNETIDPEPDVPDVLERIQRIGYAALKDVTP